MLDDRWPCPRLWAPATRCLCALILTLFTAAAAAQSEVQAAQALFERYRSLEQAFDPALADLFDDRAVIEVTRIYPDGQSRRVDVPGELYKLALRQSMKAARRHNDYNEYSQVRYAREGAGVRITALRYSVWQHYRAPCSLLVTRAEDGRWQINHAQFETRVIPPPQASGRSAARR